MIAVTILGNNSAVPSHGRNPTAQVVQTDEHSFLIDCGEGTQMQMNRYKIRRSKINHIFISHLHGDHYFGLIGLLNSYALHHRTTPLYIHGPKDLEKVIQVQKDVSISIFPFDVHFHALSGEEVLFSDKNIEVSSFKVNHRIDCWGFLIKEIKNPRKIVPELVQKFEIPIAAYAALNKGEDYTTSSGKVIANSSVTIANVPGKSYAYCADTAFYEPICDKIRGVDMVYHESTYLDELREKAKSRFHSTAKQAALIAKKANAKRLLLGHFSSMYDELELFQKQACEVFEQTEVSVEGTCYILQ